MTEKVTKPEEIGPISGRYSLWGRPAWCRVHDGSVSIRYDDGSYSSIFVSDFHKLDPKPLIETTG